MKCRWGDVKCQPAPKGTLDARVLIRLAPHIQLDVSARAGARSGAPPSFVAAGIGARPRD
jgi:hypothetical protein